MLTKGTSVSLYSVRWTGSEGVLVHGSMIAWALWPVLQIRRSDALHAIAADVGHYERAGDVDKLWHP